MKKSKSILATTMVVGASLVSGVLNNGQAQPSREGVSKEEVRPFKMPRVSDKELADLKRRILATRWPEKEPVNDQTQGVPLATMKAVADYWATEYDYRKVEAKLNALPQFITEIDGLDIHFIYVKSKNKNALPIIITHGWPGSIIEQMKLIGPLTDPTAFGGKAEDSFDVVIPSIPVSPEIFACLNRNDRIERTDQR